jgi:peptidoglycan/LPS O-acetylase OafA/YrhL
VLSSFLRGGSIAKTQLMDVRIRARDYRPDIDGLRAIAILGVVAFHAGIPGFRAGYLGVDVFFVISGFLITRLLWREHQTTGRIDLWAFYARRARRLLPTLGIVLVAVGVAGFILLKPGIEQRDLAYEVSSASTFLSNILFWRRGGYFGAPATTLPLLHTWTLAVEEQFYLVWPLLMMGVAWWVRTRASKVKPVAVVIALLAVLSWLAAFFTPSQYDFFVFYLSPFRGWEFGVGALAAVLQPREQVSATWARFAQPTGLMALGVCLLLNNDFPSAGVVAVITVGATALIIMGGSWRSDGATARVLGSRPMVGLGLLSYGWYLWHWPALSLVRVATVTNVQPVRDGLICLAALGAAATTWWLVERPIRSRRMKAFATNRAALASGAAISMACLTLAAALFASSTIRPPPGSIAAKVAAAERYTADVQFVCSKKPSLIQSCTLGPAAASRSILLLGDSHAAMIRTALVRVGMHDSAFRVVSRTMSGCRPILSPRPARRICYEHNLQVANEALKFSQQGVRGVVIASYWTLPEHKFADGLPERVRAWRKAGMKVALVAETPVFPHRPRECLLHRSVAYCGMSRATFEAQRRKVMAQLREAAVGDPGVRIFELSAPFCDERRCEVVRRGQLMFHDTHHLSVEGVRAMPAVLKPMTDWLLDGS